MGMELLIGLADPDGTPTTNSSKTTSRYFFSLTKNVSHADMGPFAEKAA